MKAGLIWARVFSPPSSTPIAGDLRSSESLLKGPPETNLRGYEYASNTRLAGNLEGELLLIHGTGDAEAPWAGTMRMVDALTRAGKYFDLIVLPDENHRLFGGTRAAYLREAARRHFVRHLLTPRDMNYANQSKRQL